MTANATAVAGMKQVQFLLDGGNLGSAVTGAGPTFTYQWNTSTLTGTHVLSAIATDNDSNTTTSGTVSVTISAGPTATFVKTDATTTGNWSGVYGTDGYIIANDADSPPAYATVILPSSTTGPQYTWAGSTADVEALSTAPFATTRIASTFYSYSDGTPYVFDINLTDGQTHQIAMYLWDLDNSGPRRNHFHSQRRHGRDPGYKTDVGIPERRLRGVQRKRPHPGEVHLDSGSQRRCEWIVLQYAGSATARAHHQSHGADFGQQ